RLERKAGALDTYKRKLKISLSRQRFVRSSSRERQQVDHESCNLLYRGHSSLVTAGSQTSQGGSRGKTRKPRRRFRGWQVRSPHRSLAYVGQPAAQLWSRGTARWHLGGIT